MFGANSGDRLIEAGFDGKNCTQGLSRGRGDDRVVLDKMCPTKMVLAGKMMPDQVDVVAIWGRRSQGI